MPLAPLPTGGALPGAEALPVTSIDDVKRMMPAFLRPDDPAPVRDAIFAGVTAICLACQDRGSYSAAQASALTATGKYLASIGSESKIDPNPNETDEDYRARILIPPDIVSPAAILAATSTILKPYTLILPKYCEANSDRIFLRSRENASLFPRAYLYKRGTIPRSPDYQDRFYDSESAQNGGRAVPGREPGKARLFKDRIGRYFVLRVPDLTSIDGQDTPVYAEEQQNGFFVGAGAVGSWTSYVRTESASSLALYDTICSVVNRLKGQSVRWRLEVDPNLS